MDLTIKFQFVSLTAFVCFIPFETNTNRDILAKATKYHFNERDLVYIHNKILPGVLF